jgi:hypothetical protein
MSRRPPADFAATFLRDVAQHELTIIRNEGLHRHLRFKRPGTFCMHFDLITWPGYLCYTGDMGTFVFKRLDDMLQFFRKNEHAPDFRIDLRYWAEKCEAADKIDGITEFSEEKFTSAVLDYLKDWIRDHREETTRDERRELWEAVIDEVLNAADDYRGDRKQIALHDFSHWVNTDTRFSFSDWERSTDEYTQRFLWCCHALEWGIERFDAATATKAVAEGVPA